MKKLYISCPVTGREFENVRASLNKMKSIAEILVGEELEISDHIYVSELKDFTDEDRDRHIKAIQECDYFIVCDFTLHDPNWKFIFDERVIARNIIDNKDYIYLSLDKYIFPDIVEMGNDVKSGAK